MSLKITSNTFAALRAMRAPYKYIIICVPVPCCMENLLIYEFNKIQWTNHGPLNHV